MSSPAPWFRTGRRNLSDLRNLFIRWLNLFIGTMEFKTIAATVSAEEPELARQTRPLMDPAKVIP